MSIPMKYWPALCAAFVIGLCGLALEKLGYRDDADIADSLENYLDD